MKFADAMRKVSGLASLVSGNGKVHALHDVVFGCGGEDPFPPCRLGWRLWREEFSRWKGSKIFVLSSPFKLFS